MSTTEKIQLPAAKITPIPSSSPRAAPGLWNSRYSEIDANFQKVVDSIPLMATTAQAVDGIDTQRAITAAGVKAAIDTAAPSAATRFAAGLVVLASPEEVQAGLSAAKAVTPAALSERTATESRSGIVALATVDQAKQGVDAAKAVTPAGVKAAATAISEQYAAALRSGNVATAARLQTPRKLNGVDFDGGKDVQIPPIEGTLSGNLTINPKNASGGLYVRNMSTEADAREAHVQVATSQATGLLQVSRNGDFGLYASSHNKWVVRCTAAGVSQLLGQADTATKLHTARTINGVEFDGSKNVTIPVIDGSKIVNKTSNNHGHGYMLMGNGFIFQWMSVNATKDANTSASFPIAFPNAIFSAQATLGIVGWSVTGDAGCGVHTLTKTSCIVRNGSSQTGPVHVFAIGN